MRWFLLPLVVLVALPTAVGAVQPGTSARPAQPPYPKLLTRAELRACMLRERDIDARSAALEAERATHDEALALAVAEAKELARELSAVPPSDESAVDRYNEKLGKHNKVVDAINKQAAALNATLVTIQADSVDYMNDCATKVFHKTDEDALIKELGPRTKPRPARPPEPTPAQSRSTAV